MKLKLVFALFHYFPYGGLERNMLAMAQACAARGHEVIIYTQKWEGEKPVAISVITLPVRSFSNHGRASEFAKKLRHCLKDQKFDLVIGFNKMPGLDICYVADVCFAHKAYAERSWLYRLSSRCRHYLALERAVFDKNSQTEIMVITPEQIPSYQRYYHTPGERMYLLPPGIRRDRIMPADYAARRSGLRTRFGLAENDYLLLMVGSDFNRKGLARSIEALAALPEPLKRRSRLWVAGQDNAGRYIELAKKHDVVDQVTILGARDDIPELMWAADLFLHPAHSEAAGAVLLEAAIAGLPVIATEVCGFAPYIRDWQMGAILTSTDADNHLGAAIENIASQDPAVWRERGHDIAQSQDIFSRSERGAQRIETIGARKKSSQN